MRVDEASLSLSTETKHGGDRKWPTPEGAVQDTANKTGKPERTMLREQSTRA